MSTKNDEKVLELQKIVREKKKLIEEKSTVFASKTNCVYKKTNLHVATKPVLLTVLRDVLSVKQVDDKIKGMELGFQEEDFLIEGFSLEDWIHDIKAKLAIIEVREEKKKLAVIEDKLASLLSEDKKVELELEEIMKNI